MTTLLKNWDVLRIVRLGLALWLAYSSFVEKQPLLAVVAGMLALQALLNVGCCGASGCATPPAKSSVKAPHDEIQYEEVK